MQRRADQATEFLALLQRAVRLGFSTWRARVLRDHAVRTAANAETLMRIDRRLRDWLERRLDRVEWQRRDPPV